MNYYYFKNTCGFLSFNIPKHVLYGVEKIERILKTITGKIPYEILTNVYNSFSDVLSSFTIYPIVSKILNNQHLLNCGRLAGK